jgi:hypothetical protein
MTTTKRSSLWVLAGVALTSIVLLADLSRLLGSIESVGQRAYDARVFTGFRVFFWNTSELGDAIRLWAETQASFDVERLLSWHLLVDAIAFTPAYSALIGLGLRALGGGRELAWTTGLALFVIDCAETATTSWVLVHHDLRITDGGWLAAIQVLSLLKWIALAATLVLALVLLRSPGGTTTTGAVRGREGAKARLRGSRCSVLSLWSSSSLPSSPCPAADPWTRSRTWSERSSPPDGGAGPPLPSCSWAPPWPPQAPSPPTRATRGHLVAPCEAGT